MKRAEKILVALALIGIIGQTANASFFSGITVLSLSLLSVFYLAGTYFLLKPDNGKLEKGQTIWSVLLGFGISNLVIGSLFAIMQWPGGPAAIQGGLLFLAVPFVVVLISYKPNNSFTKGMLQRVIPFFVVAVLLNIGGGHQLATIRYRKHPKLVQAMKEHNSSPNDTTEIALRVEYMRVRMTQEELVDALERETASEPMFQHHLEKERAQLKADSTNVE